MATVRELLAKSCNLAGDEARRDAEVLLCAALDKPRSYLLAWPDATVSDDAAARYHEWLEQRRRGQPVAYLLGEREFWSLSLTVNDATLIPRPDTELLVERALALHLPGSAAIADLGTGSGAIALALASERPHWQISAVDASAAALTVAAGNGERLGIKSIGWEHGSWFAPLATRRFDLIVSNPPYLAADDAHLQQGDLRFEPRAALVSGSDGLDDIRHIVSQAPGYLNDGGWLLLEHGFTQGAAVRELLEQSALCDVSSYCDLAGHERVSGGRFGAATPR